MNNWKETTLGEVGRIVTGKTPPTDCLDYYGGNVPFVTPRDMDYRKAIDSTERYLTEDGVNVVKGSYIPNKTIMVSCIGSNMGKVAVASKGCVTNQQINSIIVDDTHYSPDFIYYNLSQRQAEFQNLSGGGSALPILNKGHFAQITITCPPLPKQNAIAAILSSFDDKIELLRRQNKTLKQIAQTIFKEWFVNFIVNGEKLKVNSKTGLPEGWRIGNLGEIGKQITERVKNETDRKVLSAVNTGDLVLSENYFSKQVYSKTIEKYIKCDLGDFAYNPARINIGSIGRNNLGLLGAVSPVYVVFRPNACFGRWLEFIIQTNSFKGHVEKFANGSVRQTLNYDGFSRFKLVIPDKNTLKIFDELIASLDKKILSNNSQIQTLSRLRDAILPKLMKGVIRVKF